MRHSRSEKALALTVLRRESRFRRRTALRGLLEAACREVRDLARFPQSSRAVTQKRIGASTGLRVTAPSTQVPLGLRSSPFLPENRPALVVAPSPGDLEIAGRISFASKSTPRHQPDRVSVGGLNIGFEPMQLHSRERVADHFGQSLTHQTCARVWFELVIAQICAAKTTANDFADVHDADKIIRVPDEKRGMRSAFPSFNGFPKSRARSGRLYPWMMQFSTAVNGRKKCLLI